MCHSSPVHRCVTHHLYIDVSLITCTSMCHSSPVHRCVTRHLYLDVSLITCTSMCHSSPVPRCVTRRLARSPGQSRSGCGRCDHHLGLTGLLHLSISHIHPKSATAVSTVTLLFEVFPSRHYMMTKKSSMVSRYTMCGRSQSASGTVFIP